MKKQIISIIKDGQKEEARFDVSVGGQSFYWPLKMAGQKIFGNGCASMWFTV